jgi:hypothetical protein
VKENILSNRSDRKVLSLVLPLAVVAGLAVGSDVVQSGLFFTPGNLVVSVEGCGIYNAVSSQCTAPNGTGTGLGGEDNSSLGGYGDNQAAPLTLFQFQPSGVLSASFINSLVLPQTGSNGNGPVSGEYGSSSEGTVQLSYPGQYLTVMGYGINANTFNASPGSYSTPSSNTALAQSGSLTGQSYTPVPRVATLIDPYGNINSSTAILNIFNANNPRSMYTADGVNIYVSGQGTSGDTTAGVFYTTLSSSSATSIVGNDGGSGTPQSAESQDTRDVQVVYNTSTGDYQLLVGQDSKTGATNRSYIGTLGSAVSSLSGLPTTVTNVYPTACPTDNPGTVPDCGPTELPGFGNAGGTGRVKLTAAETNGIVASGTYINLSPENYFFASPSVLYVADSGSPKNTSADNETTYSLCGAGGLQKWVNSESNGSGTWTWEYTLYKGLNLVANGNSHSGDTSCSSNTDGTTGLLGLAGTVVSGVAYLYATTYTIADLDPSYLYGITDTLSTSANPGTSFTQLAQAPLDSNFKGVAFAPTLPSGSATITSSPSGLTVSTSGTGCVPGAYITPVTLIWTPSSACTLSVVSPQTATTPGAEYVFSQWQDGSTGLTDSVTAPATSFVYTATFTTEYQLTTSAGPGGTVSAGGYYPSGTNATITATPSAGYYFVNFTGTSTSTSNPFTLTMNAPQTITANFAAQTTPTINWPAPAPIAFGSALSSVQLDATASVPGVFTYTPPLGTVLPPGNNQTLSVSFTPTNTTLYTTATDSTQINVTPGASSGPADLVVTNVLTRSAGNVVVQLTIANTGGAAAANVTLTGVKLGADSGTPLPQSLGTIAPGGTAETTVTVPGSVGSSGAASSLTVTGTYTGGSFNSGARVTLP